MTPAVVYIKPTGNPHVHNFRKQGNPTLLQVTRESRAATLRRYEIASDIDKTYVNFNLDTIFIDYIDHHDLDSVPLYPSKNETRFQCLAIDINWIFTLGLEFLINKVSRCHSLRQLVFVITFTQAINKEGEVNLSKTIEKYKDIEEHIMEYLLVNMVDDQDDYSHTFTELCELVSLDWALLVRKHFSGGDRWPEISAIALPPSTTTQGLLHR